MYAYPATVSDEILGTVAAEPKGRELRDMPAARDGAS